MKLIISDEMRKKYPELRIAVVVAEKVNNLTDFEELKAKNKANLQEFAEKFENLKEFHETKNVILWRDIYRSFGTNPKKKKPSAEAFLSRVIKNGFIPSINPVVDTYLCAESLHYLPIGGYDLNKINGDIHLELSKGEEDFWGLGKENVEKTVEGEVIYRDDAEVLTRCWNYRDCVRTEIGKETNKIALFIEAPVEQIENSEILKTGEFIIERLNQYCDASCELLFLDKDANSIILFDSNK